MLGRLASHSLTRRAVVAVQPCARLVALLGDSNVTTVDGACYALSQISRDLDGARAVLEAGALGLLKKLLHSHNRRVRKHACFTLTRLAGHSATRGAVVAVRPCARLVALLREGDVDDVKGACYALAQISLDLDGARAVVAVGVLEFIKRLLEAQDSEVRKHSCWILAELAFHSSTRGAAVAIRPWARLVTLLGDGDVDIVEGACYALSNLSRSPAGAKALMEAGTMDFVAKLIDSSRADTVDVSDLKLARHVRRQSSKFFTMFFIRPLAAALLAQTTLALVPVGYTPSGLPFFLGPSGSRVKQSGRNMEVFAPNGTLIHTFEDVIPVNLKTKRQQTLARRQVVSATEAYAQFNTTADNMIESFNATFVVPPVPTSFDSQIIFLGANIQVLDANGVPFANFRAALQYGGSFIPDTGPFWTYAVQLEIPGGGYLQVTGANTTTTVDVGQRISSFIVADPVLDAEDGIFAYIAGFDNVPGSPTLEAAWSVPPQLVALDLEEEGVSGASDYPAGSFVFEQINLNLTTGPPAALYWNTSVDPTTDVQIKVDVEGSQDAQVTFVFPSA
ncbi:armadillo-type protein [Mycena metata]|uniref:Armadillo-type protein n=1 Tax=Mycena metata TaxID=1033252 RepID=A0AAD7JZW2_9AGAR|nr:armadillo-type protein [Mycena metata]